MKLSLYFLLFLGYITTATAQNYSIKGVVKQAGSEITIPNATVLLLNLPDSAQVNGMISDLDGEFEILNVKEGEYLLKVQYLGYETLYSTLPVTENLNLGTLHLAEQATDLSEVMITARRAQGEQKGDTTLFNADAFKTMKDASAQSLVEKLPGVVSQDGTLQAQGEAISQILVDGKPFFGGDVTTALQNLPAEVIQGIEIFDQKSDKALLSGFDDGERIKTINIVTKPDKRKGQFGKATVGYGTDDHYLAGASINAFNNDQRITFTGLSNNINVLDYSSDAATSGGGGRRGRPQTGLITTNILGINFSDNWGDKIKFTASYLYNNQENNDNSSLTREYVTGSNSDQLYTEDSKSTGISHNHSFNMRFEYNIDEKNRILFRPRFSARFQTDNSSFFGESVDSNGPLNQTENIRRGDYQDYDLFNRLFYSHQFDKKGRSLTLRGTLGNHRNEDESFRKAENIYFQPEQRTELIDQTTTRDRSGLTWRTGFSYTEPIGKNGQMEFEYELGNRKDDSEQLTYNILSEDPTNMNMELDTALSNSFDNSYFRQEVEIGYQYQLEKLRFQIEGQYQTAKLNNDQVFPAAGSLERKFDSFLPTVRFNYEFSNNTNISLDYDTDADAPSVGQLQNVIDNSNPLKLSTGNPNLSQSYSNSLRMRFRSNNPENDRSWFVFAQYRLVDNSISNSTFTAEEATELPGGIILEKGSQLSMPVNLDGYKDFRSWVSYGIPIDFIRSNFSINGGYSATKRPAQVNNELSFNNSSRIGAGISITSNISDQVDFNISTRSSFNDVKNTLNTQLDNRFFNQRSRLNFNWIIWEGFVYRLNLSHTINTGLSEGYDANVTLMNMSLGKKVFKNQRGEISLNVYDLLGQNRSVYRNITDAYVQDSQNNVMQRYFMLSFSYDLRHFSKGASMDDFKEIYN